MDSIAHLSANIKRAINILINAVNIVNTIPELGCCFPSSLFSPGSSYTYCIIF